MNSVCITGIPASGKSFIASKVAKATGARHIAIDSWIDGELANDPALEPWVNFYWNQDEEVYWRTTPCDRQWENLRQQSEKLWPAILKKIREIKATGEAVIFEGANLLPHLVHRDLNFSGIVLLGESPEIILERIRKAPRWGETEALQKKEAEAFWNCERPHYAREAQKYGYKTFADALSAEEELMSLTG